MSLSGGGGPLTKFWDRKTVVITGGTGSFGHAFTRLLLAEAVHAIRIVSRDEFKQSEMAKRFSNDRMRWILCDVRDRDRLRRAFDGADVVVHAAALKQVPAGEYNPTEFVKTNVIGAMNVIEASIDAGVERVMALSTDKAAGPNTLYGATKLTAEKMFARASEYSGAAKVRFSCVRYGNVTGSRGSVVPIFQDQASSGVLTITDKRMTRFWLSLGDAVRFVRKRIEEMGGGELFVPKLPSVRIVDLAEAVAPGAPHRIIGARRGEKIHETMITFDESRSALDLLDHYQIVETQDPQPEFVYDSGSNPLFLSVEEIRKRLPQALAEAAA